MTKTKRQPCEGCEYCTRGEFERNFYPQLDFNPDAEKKFTMTTHVKLLMPFEGRIWWTLLKIKGKGDFLEGAEGEPIAPARFCPMCGREL